MNKRVIVIHSTPQTMQGDLPAVPRSKEEEGVYAQLCQGGEEQQVQEQHRQHQAAGQTPHAECQHVEVPRVRPMQGH